MHEACLNIFSIFFLLALTSYHIMFVGFCDHMLECLIKAGAEGQLWRSNGGKIQKRSGPGRRDRPDFRLLMLVSCCRNAHHGQVQLLGLRGLLGIDLLIRGRGIQDGTCGWHQLLGCSCWVLIQGLGGLFYAC